MRFLANCLALLPLLACSSHPGDAAAKRRLFAPEEPRHPTPAPLDASKLDDPAQTARALTMRGDEIATRLSAFHLSSALSFTWKRGASTVTLSEDHLLEQAANGDFHARVDNDHGRGVELFWIAGTPYLRQRFGTFRKRRSDRTPVDDLRDEAAGGLRSAQTILNGALRLAPAGTGEVNGRRAVKYTFELGEPTEKVDTKTRAVIAYPSGGPDASLQRRLAFTEQKKPVAASGHLFADAETGAVLKANLSATLLVGDADSADTATLELTVRTTVTDVGADPRLQVPAWESDPATVHAVKDPLRFWGKTPNATTAASQADPTDEGESGE